jgi:Ca-activated chloride channel homolog
MRCRTILVFLIGIWFSLRPCFTQTIQTTPTAAPYTFHIPADEISLRFHASDPKGKPLTQLTVADLELSDNGEAQKHIVTLQSLTDLPIRAGFLFDISASVTKDMDFYQSVIQIYASRLLRRGVDQGFVMQFDTATLVTQNWTGLDSAIAAGAAAVGPRPDRYAPLTAIFDSLYTTCRDQWARQSESTGNFILLFTDGEDDASHAYLSEAVDMCQRKHVAIYVIDRSRSSHRSDGYKTLNDLARQTGGRVFIHPREADLWPDLQLMEAEQRNQYLLVYKPSELKADGSFHGIRLQSSVPGAHVAARSGYYAFARP